MESITRHYELVLMFDINQDESMTTSTLDKYKSLLLKILVSFIDLRTGEY